MTTTTPLTVNGKPFFGRVEEQKRFRGQPAAGRKSPPADGEGKESEYNRACFAAICGDREETLRLLEIALEKRQVPRDWARQDPDLESLHDDPRFWALVGGSEG